MKIQQVKIKDFKVLKNFEAEIAGNNIFLLGENGRGKSSVIQFLKIALGDQTNIPPNATGEGEVVTDKDGNKYTFSVKFKDGKPVVTVTSPDGMKDSRKGALASVVGAMDFDIDNFIELSKSEKGRKQQVEIFKSFLDQATKDELARYEANIKANYDIRTDVNRTLKEKEGSVKQHALYNRINVDKFEQVNVDAVYAELKSATEKNNKIIAAQTEAKNIESLISRNQSDIENLEARLTEARTSLDVNLKRNKDAAKWLSENLVTDISEFENTIKSASEKNNQYNAAILLKKDIATIESLKEEAGELTAKIDSEKEAIATAIRDMESPVSGLAFDDEQLLYNGVPVSDASLSTSEIMELGIKLKMAENPDLGIIFLERGESLGAARLKEIQDLANGVGWQLIVEQVQRGQEKLTIEIMGA